MKKKVSSIEALDKGALDAFFVRLPKSEQDRINLKKKRADSIAARYVLSEILRDLFGEDLSEKISCDKEGKPFIIGRPDIFVSLSHSDRVVAAVVSDRPVGIDIERIRTVSEKLKSRVCKKPTETDQEFFRIWTVKEAYLKAAGIKFSDMLSLDITDLDERVIISSEITDGFMLSIAEIETKAKV